MRVWLAMLLLWAMLPVQAASVAEVIDRGGLQFRAWLEPSDDIVVGRQVQLVLEVATDRWFTGGTRLSRLELDGAIVLRRERFATNFSRREKGVSWTVQQHTLTIYPQRPGRYEIAPISVDIEIAAEAGKSIKGRLFSPALSFEAMKPIALSGIENWVAAPKFAVAERFDRVLQDLIPGDAIVRHIEFTAEDIPAMALPEFHAEAFEGLAAYRKPPLVQDRVNRGEYLALRREEITYVVEENGHWILPERRYQWWDTQTNELRELIVPAHEIKVEAAAVTNGGTDSPEPKTVSNVWVFVGAAAMLVIVVVWIGLRRARQSSPTEVKSKVADPDNRSMRQRYRRAVKRLDYAAAIQILYQWYDLYCVDFRGVIRAHLQQTVPATDTIWQQLLSVVYSGNPLPPDPELKRYLFELEPDKCVSALPTDRADAIPLNPT